MPLQEPLYEKEIAQLLSIQPNQAHAVLRLTADGATVPFIARYRKEATNYLDETQIRTIIECKAQLESLYKAKSTALAGITEQWKLTPEIEQSIIACETLGAIEEIYKPYRLKRKTKAMIAIEKWFSIVADALKQYNAIIIPESLWEQYERGEILDGVREIIGAEIVLNPSYRAFLKEKIETSGQLQSKKKSEKTLEKLNPNEKKQIYKFDTYADFSRAITGIKPYQTLAIGRGENLGILSVTIEVGSEIIDQFIRMVSPITPIDVYRESILIGYKKLYESIENEIRNELREVAELDAIQTFRSNLYQLLMTKPEYGKSILAIDPGFRTGCKVAILDTLGNPVCFDKIFLDMESKAIAQLQSLMQKYSIDSIIVGNGTGSEETLELISKVTQDTPTYIVNESGASVYSASEVAQMEFPELDVTDRGTISIGRRYIDPLSELVKIPPQSIGVGMYQHDISEKILSEKLGYVIEDVVNTVWINVNTASAFVLTYISGLNKKTAQKIADNRPYHSRKSIKKMLSEKAYEQAIGFLRVPESPEMLDNTDIHPDQYELAHTLIREQIRAHDFQKQESMLRNLNPDVSIDMINFIWQSYESLGRDPRTESATMTKTRKLSLETVGGDEILDGIVRNVVAFWAFVDIGLKNDGLVHISEIVDRYIRDPKEVLEVGQKVRVKIINIDRETGKIQLSIRQAHISPQKNSSYI